MGLDILLVEDNADDAYFFINAIGKLDRNHKISLAKNHQELFSILKNSTNFDLIFMDINMPGKDGKQCLKELKSNTEYRDIPVITFTGSGLKKDIMDMYDLGAHYHIVKPY